MRHCLQQFPNNFAPNLVVVIEHSHGYARAVRVLSLTHARWLATLAEEIDTTALKNIRFSSYLSAKFKNCSSEE